MRILHGGDDFFADLNARFPGRQCAMDWEVIPGESDLLGTCGRKDRGR
jgi:hypothetical protein